MRYALWRALAHLRFVPRAARVAIANFIATVGRGTRHLDTVRPGARPLFDANVPLGDDERAEYRANALIFGMLEDRATEEDEGPDQPEPGVAVGEQRRADLE